MERSLLKLLEEKVWRNIRLCRESGSRIFIVIKKKYISADSRVLLMFQYIHMKKSYFFYVCKGNYIHEIDGNKIKSKKRMKFLY